MVFTKYTVQKGKPLVTPSPAVAATGVWADTRCKLPLPFVILEILRGRDWPLRHKIFWNCFPSLRKELEALMGPDELLTGKNTKVSRGKCIALPDAPDYIAKPLAPAAQVRAAIAGVMWFSPVSQSQPRWRFPRWRFDRQDQVINGRCMIVP